MSNKFWADPGPSLDEYPANPNENCFSLVVPAEDYDELLELLRDAREKLRLYREAHSGEYLGGVEYTVLFARIDAALS